MAGSVAPSELVAEFFAVEVLRVESAVQMGEIPVTATRATVADTCRLYLDLPIPYADTHMIVLIFSYQMQARETQWNF